MTRYRLRLRFRKEGDLRLIGHRDLMRAFERLFRRAELPLAMSEGFHPKPRLNIPAALGLGIAGTDELLEVDLAEEVPLDGLLARLAELAPPGLELTALEARPLGSPKARPRRLVYEVGLPPERVSAAAEAAARLLAGGPHWINREGRAEPLDLLAELESLDVADGRLRFALRASDGAAARPREILAALGLDDLEQLGRPLTRTAVELEA